MYKQIIIIIMSAFICSIINSQTLNEQAFALLNQKNQTLPFSFAVIGDPHTWNVGTYADGLEIVLSEIGNGNPEFVICCGDLTQDGGNGEFIDFVNVISPWMTNSDIPFFCVPGNHDLYGLNFNGWETYIDNEYNYNFDYANSSFVLLNNVNQKELKLSHSNHHYCIQQSTLNNVDNWLSNANGSKFTFMHVPLTQKSHFSCGADLLGGCSVYENDNDPPLTTYGAEPGYAELHDLHSKHNVTASFSGHMHEYKHDYFEECDGVDYFITGGAGNVISNPSYDTLEPYDSFIDFHWLWVTVDECYNVTVHTIIRGQTYPLSYYSPILCNSEYNCVSASDYETELNSYSNFQIEENFILTNSSTYNPNYFLATNNILAKDNFVLNADEYAQFKAKNLIKFEDGFHANMGSGFRASIEEYFPNNCLTDMYKSNVLIEENESVEIFEVNKALKINDNINSAIEVYPNPSSGQFNLVLTSDVSDAKVYNLTGKIMHSEQLMGSNATLNLEHLPKGLYFIEIDSGATKAKEKIIIQ